MATAEELLLSDDGVEAVSAVVDTEPHIVVGTDKCITVPDEIRDIIVQRENNIETFTFDCPRYWDGNDMSEMAIYINYQRSDEKLGSALAKNIVIDSEDTNLMHFDWTITSNASGQDGVLNFLVCIKSSDKVWSSKLCGNLHVSPSLASSEVIEEENADAIQDLYEKLVALETSGIGGVAIDATLTAEGKAADAKAVGDALALKADKTDIPTTLPASDVYEWAKATTKPTYTATEVGALPNTTVIPTTLPNPNALTFAGAVTGSYDGSEALTVNIPEGGSGGSVNDKINGTPKWEIVASGTLPSGTAAGTMTETGITYGKMNDYDYFAIIIKNATANTGSWWGIIPDYNKITAEWATIKFLNQRGLIVFKKIANGFWEAGVRNERNASTFSLSAYDPYITSNGSIIPYGSIFAFDGILENNIVIKNWSDLSADATWFLQGMKIEV